MAIKFPVTWISDKIYENSIDEWDNARNTTRMPSLGVDTKRDFFKVVSPFIKFKKKNLEKWEPLILLQDGHYSHTRNIEVISLARENYVVIICLPHHNSHKTQCFDEDFMGSPKTFYSQEIEV